MSDSFDPYYIWLGIPPDDQPPNHYRLLGLQDLEDNTDVIDAAANRQTTYLHEMAAGPNRKESQQLLNEIAAARRCLLSPDQKSEYDAKLRTERAAAQAAKTAAIPVAQAVAQPVAPAVAQPAAPAVAQPAAPAVAQPVAPAVAQPAIPAVPLINTGEIPGSEIPSFDFSAGGPAEVVAADAPGIVVNTDVGFSGVDTGLVTAATPPTQQAVSAVPNQPVADTAPTGKKPIPRQWIILGCSAAVLAIVGFFLTSGADPAASSGKAGTSTRLDGNGTAVSSGTANSSSNAEEGDASNEDSGQSLFDMSEDPDSIFQVPSSLGDKDKKKKKANK